MLCNPTISYVLFILNFGCMVFYICYLFTIISVLALLDVNISMSQINCYSMFRMIILLFWILEILHYLVAVGSCSENNFLDGLGFDC